MYCQLLARFDGERDNGNGVGGDEPAYRRMSDNVAHICVLAGETMSS